MILTLVMSVMAADAQTTDETGETTERSSSFNSGSSSGSNSKKKDSDKKDEELGGKVFKTFKIGSWKFRPYIQPGGGVQVGTSNKGTTTSVVAGADVGLKHWHKPWLGDAFLGATFTTGSAQNGYEVHIGDTFGARLDYWGLTLGLTGSYGTYTSDNGTAMKPSAGLEVPLQLTVGPKTVYGFVGVAPTFQSNPQRHLGDGLAGNVKVCTDGSVGAACHGESHQEFYLGDEFTWSIGLGLKTKTIIGSLGVQHSLSIGGSYWTPTISVGWAG